MATKYQQSYIMWYEVMHKYFASDWETWYVYMRLRLKYIVKLI
ncbi:MAG TPA: hypothetical protein PLK25_01180 [Bacteroidales bacterium]|nr:hypothetical protein [Bacteroidales bacterium]